MKTEPTIIQTPSGESFGTTLESPQEAERRLSRGWIVQRVGNVVRVVREIKRDHRVEV